MREGTFLFLLVIALPLWMSFRVTTSWAQTGTFCVPTGGEFVLTDKADYAPGENVIISGTGFGPHCDLHVRVTRPDGKVFLGDGMSNPGMDIITTDGGGDFFFVYVRQGNSISGEHVVDVLDGEINVVASAIFHNPEPPGSPICNFVVDPSVPADDPATGTFRTIQAAVGNLPNPGPCTITVLPGTYDELVNIAFKNTSATDASQRIHLQADPESPVGSVVVAPSMINSVGFTLTNSRFIALSGFVVTGANVARGVSLSGTPYTNGDITIDSNEIHNVGTTGNSIYGGIVVGSGNPRTWIVNNLVRNNAQTGIYLDAASGTSYLVNNTIYGNGWNGIIRVYLTNAGSAVAYLVNNLIVGNGNGPVTFGHGRFGLFQSGAGGIASQATLLNNMFFRNGAYSGDTLTTGGDLSSFGLLDGTDSGNYTTFGPPNPATGVAGCAFPDCLAGHAFTEMFAGETDFNLLRTPPSLYSPAIDKGRNTFAHDLREWVPAWDFVGYPRVLDGDDDGTATADMGFIEAPGNDLPPDTIIDSGPSGFANTNSAVFTFRSTKPGSTFQCRIDGGPAVECDIGSVTYSGLADGMHIFEVWATDSLGIADPIPASRTWTVDTIPPDTAFTATPAPLTSDTEAVFGFQASETGGTFECRLDGVPFSACSTPKTYTGLPEGSHVFEVRAKDRAGNADPSPAAFSWMVSIPPDTSIVTAPSTISNSSSATFGFSSTKPGSTFECSIDGSSYAACTSPATYTGLSDSGHTFAVRAVDQAGTVDVTPSIFAWTIDTAAPDTIIDSGPVNPASLYTATFGFHSSEAGSVFDCSLDGTPFSPCTSPKSYGGLAGGSHTFRVRAWDQAGNVDPTPASLTFDWNIDTTTLTVARDETKMHQNYNQNVYLFAEISSSAGVVNEGNVTFRIRNPFSVVIATVISSPVTEGKTGNTPWNLAAGTPAGVYTIEASYSGGPNFRPSTGTGTLLVVRVPATITLGNLVQNYDGTPKPVTVNTNPPGLAVSVTYDGSPSPPVYPGTYSVVASMTDPNYTAPAVTGTLTIIGKAVPEIIWSVPGDIVFPTPLDGTQLNAMADVPGTFIYTPPAGTVLGAGTHVMRVDFLPTDTTNYMGTFRTVPINVLKGSQTIDFEPPADRVYGDPGFIAEASSSSGLPVTFTASGDCVIAEGIVFLTGAGSCTVTASQGGDSNYHPALDVARSFSIDKAPASMYLGDLVQTYDGSPKTAAAYTDPPGLYFVAVTYDGSPTPPTEAGSYAVSASLDNPDFQAPDATGTLTIIRADAGADQTVDEGTGTVSIGSSQSYGSTYLWAQLAGPPVLLEDPARPLQSFPVPFLDGGFGSQVVTFELTAGEGDTTTSDTVNITVKNVNHAPVADPGSGQTVNEEAPVTLSGTHSYDPDGDPVTFQWVQTAGIGVALDGAETDNVVFTAPLLPGGTGTAGVLTFQLTVSDGELHDSKTVNVTVEQVNHAPTANAGQDQTRNEWSVVTLAGEGTDPDGDPLTYRWTQVSGPSVTLSSSQDAAPSFTAPSVGPGGATLVFRLVTSDGMLESEPDEVAVTVLDLNDPPACEVARPDQETLWPPNHKLVAVRIVGITDPNDDAVGVTVTGVTQDEPVDGLGDGDTSPDAVIQGDKIMLRAERAGHGNGRVYEVSFTADDGNGGICAGAVRIGVPPNMKKGISAIGDGQAYLSTSP